MQGPGTGTINPAAQTHHIAGRTPGNGTDRGFGKGIWTIRIQKDNGNAAQRGMESEPQEGGENLETGRIESTAETTQEGQALAQRRQLCEIASFTQGPCMELRLHG